VHAWETRPDGVVIVDGAIPRLQDEALFATRLAPLRAIFDAAAAQYGIASAWLAGQAWQESRLNPRVIGHDPGGSTGVGLFQLTSSRFKAHHTLAELQQPEVNTDEAARFLAELAAGGADLPAVASMFNAGAGGPPGAHTPHRSTTCLKVSIVDGKPVGQHVGGNLWGYAQACGHLDGVVRGNNSAILLGSAPAAGDGTGIVAAAACLLLPLFLR
jgi:soluble lytic murein transglycosylase-like protein